MFGIGEFVGRLETLMTSASSIPSLAAMQCMIEDLY